MSKCLYIMKQNKRIGHDGMFVAFVQNDHMNMSSWVIPSKHFKDLKTFDRKRLAKVIF